MAIRGDGGAGHSALTRFFCVQLQRYLEPYWDTYRFFVKYRQGLPPLQSCHLLSDINLEILKIMYLFAANPMSSCMLRVISCEGKVTERWSE